MNAPRWGAVAIATGTLMFGAAIAYRHDVNPWWSNTAAAVVAIALSGVVLRAQLRRLLAVDVRSALLAVGAGFAMVVLTHLSFRVGIRLFPGLEANVAELYSDIRASNPGGAMTILLLITIVFAEEILWRGVAIELCRRRLSRSSAALVAVGLYAAPQLIGGAPVLVAAALAVGAIFTLQRSLTGRVTDPFITHAIWSVSIFSVAPLG